jgi:uncharacterized protein (DUF1800 family)
MLFYLDNWQSSDPNASLRPERGGGARPRPGAGLDPSRGPNRRPLTPRQRELAERLGTMSEEDRERLREQLQNRMPRGLNENYARELLELHTLGVDGGYAQQDVIEVARVLTGWSLTRELPPRFAFRPALHDPGRKRVLGARVQGEGIEEGLWLLRFLARHPSTARFVSFKLARRFVADVPPPALVERLARRFLDTEGDIAALLRTLFAAPEFIAPEHRKFKTPLEFVASALRATGGETDGGAPLRLALAVMGELPFFARTPDGYPDTADEWLGPSAILTRLALAFHLSQRGLGGTRLGKSVPELYASAVSSGASPAERVALAVAAPEFQWQ